MNKSLLALAVLLAACQPTSAPQMEATPATGATISSGANAANRTQSEVIPLPTLRPKGSANLEEVLAQRRSVRQFAETPVTMAELGQLLWAAQGVTDPAGLRTAPSAGALYPLEVYAVTREGVYHYEPAGHRVMIQVRGDSRRALYAAALEQDAVLSAPVTIVFAAVYARTSQKYGDERGPRYVHLEVGHAAQNILLQAVALNLGAVPIGAFEDARVKQVLGLPSNQQPLYLIPIAHPR